MLKRFVLYFFHFILFKKTRQRILIFAMAGLILSSFALLVMQSVMEGLQKGLVDRSKYIRGDLQAILEEDISGEEMTKLVEAFASYNLSLEYEAELLLKHDTFIQPVVFHGIWKEFGRTHQYSQADGVVLGGDLAYKLSAIIGADLELISPVHTNTFWEDIPRYTTVNVANIVYSNVPEVDGFHAWGQIHAIWEIIREQRINRLRFFDLHKNNLEKIKGALEAIIPGRFSLKTWEEQNQTLLWSLNLESKVMLLLFCGMSFLVAISISSGFMIFFDKVKSDLLSFWLLGSSTNSILTAAKSLIHVISFISVLLGMILGIIVLYLLESYGHYLMPDIFIERGIPVDLTLSAVLTSFFIPYSIAFVFSRLSLSFFKERGSIQTKLLKTLRTAND